MWLCVNKFLSNFCPRVNNPETQHECRICRRKCHIFTVCHGSAVIDAVRITHVSAGWGSAVNSLCSGSHYETFSAKLWGPTWNGLRGQSVFHPGLQWSSLAWIIIYRDSLGRGKNKKVVAFEIDGAFKTDNPIRKKKSNAQGHLPDCTSNDCNCGATYD